MRVLVTNGLRISALSHSSRFILSATVIRVAPCYYFGRHIVAMASAPRTHARNRSSHQHTHAHIQIHTPILAYTHTYTQQNMHVHTRAHTSRLSTRYSRMRAEDGRFPCAFIQLPTSAARIVDDYYCNCCSAFFNFTVY